MGFFRNQTFALAAADSVRPFDYSVSDSRVASTPSLSTYCDTINIELLYTKHPEPAHPARDPVCMSSTLWPRPQALQDYKWFKYH